jgi:aryl-alcohol dehydrogenase-like predicted oxidoreductase
MTSSLPASLASWSDAPRVRVLNDAPIRQGRYVLCWLQQALRARDNPVIDAAVRLLIGTSTVEELDHAVAAVNKGALPETTLAKLAAT